MGESKLFVKSKHVKNKRIALGFLAFTFFAVVAFSPKVVERHMIRRVVLDAGHGGKDPGNLGTGTFKTTEKDVTLDVTLLVGNYIKEHYPEVEVVYTRDDDSFPSLKDRVNIANGSNADLFISIHCDAFTKPTAKGSGTYVMGMHRTDEALRVAMKENASIYMEENYQETYEGFDPKDPDTYIALTLRQNAYLEQSLNLSQRIQNQFRTRVGRVDRGVRQAGYYVICFTSMPSVLVELGFLTNIEEEVFLNSEEGKTYMASAIYRAFKEYKSEIEGVEIIKSEEEKQQTFEKGSKSEKDHTLSLPPFMEIGIIDENIEGKVKYQVQILSSPVPIPEGDLSFQGHTKVDEYISNDVYKYAVGCTDEYEKAKQMQIHLRENGFPGAFVIAFEKNKRVELHKALQAQKK